MIIWYYIKVELNMTNNFITAGDTIVLMCAVCLSERSGAQIAVFVIVSGLILLGLANWALKKYLVNKKKIFKE